MTADTSRVSLYGPGGMAALMRARDRAETPLGRTSTWTEHPDGRDMTHKEVCKPAGGGSMLRFENRFRRRCEAPMLSSALTGAGKGVGA